MQYIWSIVIEFIRKLNCLCFLLCLEKSRHRCSMNSKPGRPPPSLPRDSQTRPKVILKLVQSAKIQNRNLSWQSLLMTQKMQILEHSSNRTNMTNRTNRTNTTNRTNSTNSTSCTSCRMLKKLHLLPEKKKAEKSKKILRKQRMFPPYDPSGHHIVKKWWRTFIEI